MTVSCEAVVRPAGCFPETQGRKVGHEHLQSLRYPKVKTTDPTIIGFDTLPARDGWTETTPRTLAQAAVWSYHYWRSGSFALSTTSAAGGAQGIKQLHHIWLRCAFLSQQPTTECHLRSTTLSDLAVPRIRLTRYGRRSFSVSGPLLWNSLPLTVRDVSLTLTQFCAWLKTFLFSRAYGTSS